MKYQLVIQFDDGADDLIEQIDALEAVLADVLDGIAEVEGHEVGTGTANLILDTDNPKKAWSKAEASVESATEEGGLTLNAVAYRDYDDEDDYTVLWPSDFDGEFDIS
ncbi:MAG: hypothetical protein KDJ37_15650 [Hyphomicrobiaceae bacterium]|nr:hypothetical protein [Hyphomicrobiaceae bacterium]